METPLIELSASNFLSLKEMTLPLGPLSVLVGPNASGKTNVLKLIQFLGAAARDDLAPALRSVGGFDRLRFRGSPPGTSIRIGVKAVVTKHAHADAPDEYVLDFREPTSGMLVRKETFTFKRHEGRGRRLTISGSQVTFGDGKRRDKTEELLRKDSLALSTLPRLPPKHGGEEVNRVANLFTTFRVFEPDVRRARMPSSEQTSSRLTDDASNLAAFLRYLQESGTAGVFDRFETDAKAMVPGLEKIEFVSAGGPSTGVAIELRERGLGTTTRLGEASFGTVRALALLALLHDPDPPRLTCIEEVDHGLHPHLFDLLVERMREASSRSQFLIATHSPALVNRLNSSELVVCERNPDTGESHIPAIDAGEVEAIIGATKTDDGQAFRLGELWFAGTLGGVPNS